MGNTTQPLCDICGIGRAPFLRYGTLDRAGHMCADCLRRTPICSRCRQPGGSRLVPLHTVDQGTGPGWTEYACLACTDQKPTDPEAKEQSPVSVLGCESHAAPPGLDTTGLSLERGAT